MKKHMMYNTCFGVHIVSLLLITACGNAGSSVITPVKKNSPQIAAVQNPKLQPIDPVNAKISIAMDLMLSPINDAAVLSVPSLTLAGVEEGSADFVQVARCNASTKLKTSTGENIADLSESDPLRLEKLKWVWINGVWGNPNACVIIGGSDSQIVTNKFQDISAKSGDFFYVVNPCLNQNRSTKKDNCSYNLVFSKDITYTNSLSEEFLTTAAQLMQAQGVLAGQYSQLNYLAFSIMSNQNACENNYAVSEARKNFWKGLGSLSIAAVGAVIGGVVSGGSAALIGFRAGITAATMFFGSLPKASLVCPIVDNMIQNAQNISGQLDKSLDNIINIRIKLGDIEATYGRLDKELFK